MKNDENPTGDRVIDNIDNNPPEALPPQLASVAEVPTMIKADIDHLVNIAVLELDTFTRVPTEIGSDDVYQRVTTLATRIKGVIDEVDDRRGKQKRPYLDVTKLLDDSFKLVMPDPEGKAKDRVLRKELDTAFAALKGRLSAYDTKQYLAAKAVADAENQRIAEQAAKDGIEMGDVAAPTAIAATVKSAHGGQSVRKVTMEWEVVDETLLPRSVLSVDPAKVQALIDQGVKAVPGIAFSEKVGTYVKKR